MKRCLFFHLLSVCFLLGSAAVAADKQPSTAKLGTKIANVVLPGVDGTSPRLYDFKDKKALVVIVLNFDCPNSTGYTPTLNQLVRDYADKGVAFLGVCPADEDAAALAKQARDFQLAFPIYRDAAHAIVDALKAETTPEAFLLDHNAVLRYRGRIDDGYAARLKKNLVIKNQDLRQAIDEQLAGKPVANPATMAVGCPIVHARTVKKDGTVTYHRDVLPILQNQCQSCHRPGQVAPFALMTYKQAVNWADDIKEYTQTRKMPPWKISAGLPFHNERKLSDREVATLAAWVDEGTPEGDASEAPTAKPFPDSWMFGTPDLVLSPSADFVLGPGGRDLFRCFTLPTNLPEDKFVVAWEVRPGNPRIVHHTLNFVDTNGKGRALEKQAQEREKESRGAFDRGPGYSQAMGVGFLPRGAMGGWAPGQMPHTLPEGFGFPLPKGSDLVVQVHYHRDGRVEKDRVQIGLYFAKKSEGMKPFKGGIIAGLIVAIPAGSETFKVKGTAEATADCTLHNIMPHMHLIGRSIKVTMREPGAEQSRTLLDIKDWDYNWQETYFLKTPVPVPKGTTFEVEAVYNNSTKNPNNPNHPPRTVILGEQTTDEMCFVFLGATTESRTMVPIVPKGLGGRARTRQP